jgi:putative transposase
MKRMGIEAIYRRPSTSKSEPGQNIFPYLLRKLPVTRSNQVWAMDLTYIPMARGLCLSRSRHRLVQPQGAELADIHHHECGVLHRGCRGGARPLWQARHLQYRQGSQFTSVAFTGLPLKHEIKISMDGKGAWRDNVFVKRLWRSVKYEEVYLHAHDSVAEARASIGQYMSFYNGRRPHSSLDRRTPDQAYAVLPTPIPAAA